MPHIVLLLYWPLMFYKNRFELKACPKMSLFKWDMSWPHKMFIATEIMFKSRQYQISRSWIVFYFNLLTSDNPNCFAFTSTPCCHTENFLYSRWIYGSQLSSEIGSSLPAYLYPEKLSKMGGAVFLVTPWIVYYLWAPKMTHFFKTSFSIFSICFSTLDH